MRGNRSSGEEEGVCTFLFACQWLAHLLVIVLEITLTPLWRPCSSHAFLQQHLNIVCDCFQHLLIQPYHQPPTKMSSEQLVSATQRSGFQLPGPISKFFSLFRQVQGWYLLPEVAISTIPQSSPFNHSLLSLYLYDYCLYEVLSTQITWGISVFRFDPKRPQEMKSVPSALIWPGPLSKDHHSLFPD